MKKAILFLSFVANAFLSYGQTTVGLIAHWDMNGTTNDVSGNGHNGNGNNLTAAKGMDGVMGHAWYFNGVNSWITIPYSPAFNVTQFTISATIMIQGFYNGICHTNMILCRGASVPSNGNYSLNFDDYPAGSGCTPGIDTTQESFILNASSAAATLDPTPISPFNDTPHLVINKWYTVVATFNDTAFKIYINNVLKKTIPTPTQGKLMISNTDRA